MDRAAAADGKQGACVEPSGADNKMKAKVSIVRTDPFTGRYFFEFRDGSPRQTP